MRYTIMYDDILNSWAVVDTKAAGMVIAIHEGEEAARDAAWREEERWFKCHPPTSRRSWLSLKEH